ncbi:MAG TPA: nucleic acid-binding protein [Methanocorpusculum sp.]|nr:nucleic acid-binding protein [Methanocorpusculum sp.]HJJ51456.1 nucleic acid-binding protein [Methanocorpusculum sp.]
MNSSGGSNGQFVSYEREPAKRVFAAELREATKTIKDTEDEKSPAYLLLPTGERCNRVLIAGTITQKDKVGDQNILYRARVSDPTGVFYINASSYQPEAMHQLAKIDTATPSFVIVVGKPNAYTTPDGKTLISVRAESILVVNQETRDLWIQDAANSTLDRVDAFASDCPSEDVLLARDTYHFAPGHWKKMVSDALSRMMQL